VEGRLGLRVIIEGFGGQGVKSAGDLLVTTLFLMGRRALGMPIYEPLQMGGLVTFSLAMDSDGDRVVPTHDRDVFIMMHRRLFTRAEGETVRPSGLIIANAAEPPDVLMDIGRDVAVIDADRLAREHGLLAKGNVPNLSTVMAGAFARLCEGIDYEALETAVREAFPKLITPNLRALRSGYDGVRIVENALA
jgi:Pyruvate/2-oxoacid:ferredoxin oxidoreductase gamma subunit